MSANKKNLAASVAARLLTQAKRNGGEYQILLTQYCLERFLHRLGASEQRQRFVLKGAMLLRLWSEQPYRATLDLDLLRRGDGSSDAIRDDLQLACSAVVADDAVEFEPAGIQLEAIRAEDESAGVRANLPARVGSARLTLQIDVGVGDSVWPAPKLCAYPTLLDFPAPEVFAYPREAVVAEKLEALVVLGDRNSRIKDFFDLHHLAMQFEFDRVTLTEAVRRTFQRRGTPIPEEPPIGLTRRYWENPSRPAQLRAFARRARLELPDDPGAEFPRALSGFLSPILADLMSGDPVEGLWLPGGQWRPKE